MKNLLFIIIFLFSFIVFLRSEQMPSDKQLLSLLPQVEGWKLAEKPEIYIRENLFDYIDGNCELYYSYGFKKLVSGYYEKDDNPNASVTVDIYHMGTPKGAFGVYSSMSNPDYTYEEIGCEAIVSPYQLQFWQDRYEVEIRGAGIDESSNVLKTFAHKVLEKLPPCSPLEIIFWLPEKGRVPHSFKYIAEGFLGQDYFPGGVEALYKIDGKEVKGFVTKANSVKEANEFLRKYRKAQMNFKDVQISEGKNFFTSFHRYTGHMRVEVLDNWIFGAISQSDVDGCNKLVSVIRSHLASREK